MDHLGWFQLGTLALGTHHGLTHGHMDLAEAFVEANCQMCHFKLDCLEIVYFIVNPNTSPKDMEIWPEDSGEPVLYVLARWGQEIPGSGWEIPQCFNKYTASIQVALLQSLIFRIQSPETRREVSFWEKLQVHISSPMTWTSSILTNTMCLTQRVIYLLSIWTSA